MSKRTNTPATVEIDGDYERHVNALDAMQPGHVSDYAIEPHRPQRPQPPKTWVPGQSQRQDIDLSISPADTAFLTQAHQAVGQVVNAPRRDRDTTAHTRQNDSAMTVAKSSAFYAMLYIIAFALGAGILLTLAWWNRGGEFVFYFATYAVLLTGFSLWMLERNRERGLHHSSTGIAHHELDVEVEEIQSRERIALGVVDRHIALLERKLEIEARRLEVRNGRDSDR